MSNDSPGRVFDLESLHFLVTDPQTIDPRSGRLLPGAVNQVYQAGLSMLRSSATNQEFDITFSMMKEYSDSKGKERFWHSVSTINARSVRYDGNRRVRAIFDTAYPDRPAHVDVMSRPENKRDREQQTKMLLDKMSASLTEVTDFRQGAFIRHARPT